MLGRSRLRQDAPPEPHERDDDVVEGLYIESVPAIYRFIYSKVGNREEAEDLTSQVFEKALQGLDQTRDRHSMQSWLFQVARTVVADHWRSFYRLHADSLDALLTLGFEAPAEGDKAPEPPDERVEVLLAKLPARYREVLTLRFLLNYSIKETADHMRLSEANVKVLQFRALKRAGEIDAAHRNLVQ